MSLLKRIEGATGAPAPGAPVRPAAPVSGGPPPGNTGRLLDATNQLRSLSNELGVASRPGTPQRDEFATLRARVQDKLIQEIGTDVDYQQIGEMRKRVQQMFDSILEQEGTQLTRADRTRVF